MKRMKKGLVAIAGVLAAALFVPAVVTAWTADDYTGNGQPQFNTYNNVPGFGNESDFLRLGKNGANTSTFGNNFEACEGEVRISTYIHNGAPKEFNGQNNNGSGVAKDTRLKIAVPSQKSNAVTTTATISASNATSVSDGATITCGDHEIEVEYVPGSATIFGQLRGESTLSNNIVSANGTLIGTYADDGIVAGCWDQRVYVSMLVKIKKVEKPKKSIGECEVLKVEAFDKRRVKAVVNGTVENAKIIGYRIDFGDGTVVNEKNAEHTYDKDGDYKITASVRVQYADGTKEWKTASNCMAEVSFESEKPKPEEPKEEPEVPAVLPSTGPADMIGLFAAVSVAGGLAHKFVYSRRFM